jgi:hypothetical protein
MTVLNQFFVRVFTALFFTTLILHGSEMEMLPGNFVRVGVNHQSQRVAVDASRNLLDWTQLTNIAPAAGQITFANDPTQADPVRFFRIADADETFAVAGYVDGGQFFGGFADATVWEERSAQFVKSDRNGFFHFNDRYYRTNFPMRLYSGGESLEPAAREIRSADAGSFVVLSTPLGQPSLLNSVGDQTYHFYVMGGARAGLDYSIRFHGGQVSITGGISGDGTFREIEDATPLRYVATLGSNTNSQTEMFFWPIRDTMNQGFGYFSGIPGTNGTITGNGMITWDTTPVAPSGLEGLAFSIGDNKIQFNNGYDLVWNGAYSAGTAVPSREDNTWTVALSPFGGDGLTNTLQLYFASATNGSYTMQMAGQQPVSGSMQQIPYMPWVIDPNGEVQPLSTIKITVEEGGVGPGLRYTINMHAGNFLAVTDAGDLLGSGTFTYTPNGTRFAHLRLNYIGAFAGDYDDMNLEFRGPAGSTIPSVFTGTQRISTTQYFFRGTFLY